MPKPPERNVEETGGLLARWLARVLPAATGIEVRSLGGPEDTGFSSDTLLYDFVWRENGELHEEPVVVRLEPSGFRIFPDYDISLQYRCMEKLRGIGVPTPRMYWLEESPEPLGAPFYVMERLEGVIPPDRPPYHMDGWMTQASPQTRRAIWNSGLEAMAKVHTADWESLGFDFLDRPELGARGLDQQLAYYRSFMDWALGDDAHPVCQRAYEWLDANRPGDEPLRLCWGDARIGNMIFRDERCVAVIDWEMAVLGNPVQDLAWYIYLDRHHCEGIGVERLDGLPSRVETVAFWERATGLPAAGTLDYYEIFAAFRFAVIMVRVGRQMMHYELLPADSDFHVQNPASALLEKILP